MAGVKVKEGYRVGQLTVEAPTEARKGGYTVWKCRCDCGNTILLDTRYIQRGTVTDCGCVSKLRTCQRDITGERFGMLTAIEPTEERKNSGSTVWRCQCDCGGTVYASLHQLQSGYRKSCGCLSHPPLKDWIGKRFGKLVVTEYAGKSDGMHQWRCVCDCGNETVVAQSRLQEGKTKSCGCLQNETLRGNLKLVDGTSVTRLETGMNRVSANNTSGCTGVYYKKKNHMWAAEIRFKGKHYYLGSYADKQDAIKARRRGEEMMTDFINWYYSEYTGTGHIGTGNVIQPVEAAI